jgi:hypothetical protein
MEQEFQKSATFGQYYKICMSGKRTFKGNSWNLSKTIKISSEVIKQFTSQTVIKKFPQFFTHFLAKKFKKKSARTNYALIIFFSLLANSAKSFEVQIYRRLFNSSWDKSIFHHWIKVRKNVCIAKGINYTTDFMLESVFLQRSEADVIAKRSGYRDIASFKQWIEETEKKVRDARKLKEK